MRVRGERIGGAESAVASAASERYQGALPNWVVAPTPPPAAGPNLSPFTYTSDIQGPIFSVSVVTVGMGLLNKQGPRLAGDFTKNSFFENAPRMAPNDRSESVDENKAWDEVIASLDWAAEKDLAHAVKNIREVMDQTEPAEVVLRLNSAVRALQRVIAAEEGR
jgi:hypothetical protein